MANGSTKPWSEQEDALLRKLLDDGFTASQASGELAKAGFPVRSRNAVLGRAHRVKIPNRNAVVATANRVNGAKKAHAAKAARAPKMSAAASRKPGPGAHGLGGPPMALMPAVQATIKGWPKPRGPNAIRFLDVPYLGRCKMPLWGSDEPLHERFVCGEPCDAARVYCPSCAALTVSSGTLSEQTAIRSARSIAKKEAA